MRSRGSDSKKPRFGGDGARVGVCSAKANAGTGLGLRPESGFTLRPFLKVSRPATGVSS